MLKYDTKKIQEDLAMYCRSGQTVELPGTRKERLPHYRRLVYNVVNNTMEHAFPITFEILAKEEWKELIGQFILEHDPQSPKIWELPYELYQYARDHHYAKKFSKAYLYDLMYFEWIEIEVHTMPDHVYPEFRKEGDLLQDPLVMNRESRLIRLRYPIHISSVMTALKNEGNYYIFIFREPETGAVKFMNLTALHVYIFEKLYLGNLVVNGFIKDIAGKFEIHDTNLLKNEISRFLNDLKDLGGILGFREQNIK